MLLHILVSVFFFKAILHYISIRFVYPLNKKKYYKLFNQYTVNKKEIKLFLFKSFWIHIDLWKKRNNNTEKCKILNYFFNLLPMKLFTLNVILKLIIIIGDFVKDHQYFMPYFTFPIRCRLNHVLFSLRQKRLKNLINLSSFKNIYFVM